jgi:hypothetical protein
MNALTAVRNTSDAAAADDGHVGSDGEQARALVERLRATSPRSTAEILYELRRAFPHSPLSVRIAALAALRER